MSAWCSGNSMDALRLLMKAWGRHDDGVWLPLSISWFMSWLMTGDMIKNNNKHLLGDRPLFVNDQRVKKCRSNSHCNRSELLMDEHAQLRFDGCKHGITWVWINQKYHTTLAGNYNSMLLLICSVLPGMQGLDPHKRHRYSRHWYWIPLYQCRPGRRPAGPDTWHFLQAWMEDGETTCWTWNSCH